MFKLLDRFRLNDHNLIRKQLIESSSFSVLSLEFLQLCWMFSKFVFPGVG